VRVAANSPETFPFAARLGLPIFAAPLINPPERLKAGLRAYRETLPAGAKGDTALAFSVHVSTSRAQARQDTEAGLLRFLREAAERLRPVGQGDIKSFEAFRQVLARIERVRYEDIESEMAVFGDPEYCIERVQALRREYGMDEFICYFNQGGVMDHAMVKQSMTSFARDVMPYCR
jgi:alkanesulfonate monooxygenase SsuD/methylene tetrahydromethanopterin reductase-like flavin-dependent oxidoreductase (luciferase family)